MICTQCGQAVPHNFLHSRCEMCGLTPVFTDRVLDLKYFNASDRPGTVETREYMTHDYFTEGQTWGYAPLRKKLCVYLPWGYDPSEKYDVMILLHGSGGSEYYWLREAQQITHTPGYGVYTSNMLDNLMASGYCRKMIVVTPTFYRNSGSPGDYSRDIDEVQFVKELCADILPFIVDTYSTYARSSSREDISAARAHFAYAGLSMGSIYAYTSVMPECLDLFGWFGCFSGSDAYMDRLVPAMNAEKNAKYPIYYFYNSIGAKDGMFDIHYNQYYQLSAQTDAVEDGDNAAFTTINACAHDYRAWGTGLYNFLRVVFAQPAQK
jgi:enterochelin esterase-like enzyme